MIKITPQSPKNFSLTIGALLAFSGAFSTPAHAQESKLVISTKSADTIKSEVNYEGSGISLDGKIIPNLETTDSEADIEQSFETYSEERLSTYEFKTQSNAKLSLGVLPNGTDTADGNTQRDPYSIDDVEVDPIYPEGIYVDEMRATAGVGILSKF